MRFILKSDCISPQVNLSTTSEYCKWSRWGRAWRVHLLPQQVKSLLWSGPRVVDILRSCWRLAVGSCTRSDGGKRKQQLSINGAESRLSSTGLCSYFTKTTQDGGFLCNWSWDRHEIKMKYIYRTQATDCCLPLSRSVDGKFSPALAMLVQYVLCTGWSLYDNSLLWPFQCFNNTSFFFIPDSNDYHRYPENSIYPSETPGSDF